MPWMESRRLELMDDRGARVGVMERAAGRSSMLSDADGLAREIMRKPERGWKAKLWAIDSSGACMMESQAEIVKGEGFQSRSSLVEWSGSIRWMPDFLSSGMWGPDGVMLDEQDAIAGVEQGASRWWLSRKARWMTHFDRWADDGSKPVKEEMEWPEHNALGWALAASLAQLTGKPMVIESPYERDAAPPKGSEAAWVEPLRKGGWMALALAGDDQGASRAIQNGQPAGATLEGVTPAQLLVALGMSQSLEALLKAQPQEARRPSDLEPEASALGLCAMLDEPACAKLLIDAGARLENIPGMDWWRRAIRASAKGMWALGLDCQPRRWSALSQQEVQSWIDQELKGLGGERVHRWKQEALALWEASALRATQKESSKANGIKAKGDRL